MSETDRLIGRAAQEIRLMSQEPKDTRSAAEKTRDIAGIIGSLKHEGYLPTPQAEAVHHGSAGRSEAEA